MKRILNSKLISGILLAATAVCQSPAAKAQDVHFSQFYENALLRNPALTGIFSGDYKYGVNYRNQWATVATPFQTIMASAEARFPLGQESNDYLSAGLTTVYDHAGAISFNSLQIFPALNYNKALGDKHQSYLSIGIAGGYIQRSVDQSKMTFGNQYQLGGYNAGNSTGETMSFGTISHWDATAGLSFNSSIGDRNQVNYYFGAAAYHLLQPKEAFNNDETFIKLPIKYNGNFGFNWNITDQVGFTAHFNYSNQHPYQEAIGGGLISWRHVDSKEAKNNFTIYGGMFYRVNDAWIPTFKLDYHNYSLTLSYDINNSSLTAASNGVGGMEISLYSRGNLNFKKSKTECPRFEQMMPGFEEQERPSKK